MNQNLTAMGVIRYNPDTQILEVYDGNSWTDPNLSNTGSAWNEKSKKNALDRLFEGVK